MRGRKKGPERARAPSVIRLQALTSARDHALLLFVIFKDHKALDTMFILAILAFLIFQIKLQISSCVYVCLDAQPLAPSAEIRSAY